MKHSSLLLLLLCYCLPLLVRMHDLSSLNRLSDFDSPHVSHYNRVEEDVETLMLHVHIPKSGGTFVERFLPGLLNLPACWSGRISESHHSRVRQWADLAPESCLFLSVEGTVADIVRVPSTLAPRVAIFALLREPLTHEWSKLVHEFKHRSAPNSSNDSDNDNKLVNEPLYSRHLLIEAFDQERRLSHALDMLHRTHFGLMEFMHASVCLALWAWRSPRFALECTCDSSPLTLLPAANVAADSNLRSFNLSVAELHEMWDELTDERAFYAYARQLFIARVRYIEHVSHQRFFCNKQLDAVRRGGSSGTNFNGAANDDEAADDEEKRDGCGAASFLSLRSLFNIVIGLFIGILIKK